MTPDQLDALSVAELKSLAYDQISLLEQTRNNLQVLNTKIAEKTMAIVKSAPVKPELSKKQ